MYERVVVGVGVGDEEDDLRGRPKKKGKKEKEKVSSWSTERKRNGTLVRSLGHVNVVGNGRLWGD